MLPHWPYLGLVSLVALLAPMTDNSSPARDIATTIEIRSIAESTALQTAIRSTPPADPPIVWASSS